MDPTVSVIIPNYNHALFLKERIESVLNQTYGDYEVIILDDNSSDNSREVIERFRSNPRISHIVYNDVNSGSTFKQWEKGINLAKGEIIWIAESDDIADLEFLSTLVPLMNEESVDIVFCGSSLIDADSNPLPEDRDIALRRRLNGREKYHRFDAGDFFKSFMIFENFMYNASAILFKKSLWNKIEHDFLDYKSCGDWLCWIRMLLKSKYIIWHSAKFNRFRIHTNKVSPTMLNNGLMILERKSILDNLLSLGLIGEMMKPVVIGGSYNMIYAADLEKKVKSQVLKVWKESYPNPLFCILSFFTYLISRKIKSIIFSVKTHTL